MKNSCLNGKYGTDYSNWRKIQRIWCKWNFGHLIIADNIHAILLFMHHESGVWRAVQVVTFCSLHKCRMSSIALSVAPKFTVSMFVLCESRHSATQCLHCANDKFSILRLKRRMRAFKMLAFQWISNGCDGVSGDLKCYSKIDAIEYSFIE